MEKHISRLRDSITIPDIVKALEDCPPEHYPQTRIGIKLKRSKMNLIETLLKEGPYWVDKLYIIAADNDNEQMRIRQAKRTRHNDYVRNMRQEARISSLKGDFLDLPSQHEYLKSTSNTSLEHLTCAVCARLLRTLDSEFTTLELANVPNRNRLQPHVHHPAHILTDGCLLEKKGYDQLQYALRGNVTSFEMNSDAVTEMIKGNLMPQRPTILASVLAVTFIGHGKIPNPAALKLFRVRREMVTDALVWLKRFNLKYYGNINIDPVRLAELPVDDVPHAIKVNIHHEEDTSLINAESDGYIPEISDDDDDPHTALMDNADVVPLQYLGLTTNEMMNWGLQNMWKRADDSEWGYAVRHGAPGKGPADPDRRNYWESAFPLLYPYGIGVQLSFIEHVRWALRYHDRRFRYHNTFIFAAFGIQQRRQMLIRRDFESAAQTLSSITLDDLRYAAQEEELNRPPSNPAIQVLKRHMTATSRRLRSQIRSTSLYLNQPTIWMTINPDDLHDPIAQVFAGEEVNMDDFIKTAGLDKTSRSRNIARDPIAAAEFFKFTITLILKELFGITSTASRVHSSTGVLGKLKGYFGTVECQGRGTLHLHHMLLWLHNAPPPRRLKELLQTEDFRAKLANPVKVVENPPDAQVAYSRCPDPQLPIAELLLELKKLEVKVVRTKQIHKCVERKCLRYDKHGKQDSVDSDGTYRTKRSLAFLNGYCPALAETMKCNQDIKVLLHGCETKHLIFYLTKYMAKPEGRTHNVLSLLIDEDPTVKSLIERQHDLILQAVNVLNREQEVPAPLVATYLMGWGDVYRSHQYAIIYWGSFASHINRMYPDLRTFP
ncbi:hypothetical protein BDV93DRAFT_534310 [Ceratobasidium sp. AG-I]|nr:hypothetical protein BDV93DRAFT_534310 [Ceratobasidium sp. AG-I]